MICRSCRGTRLKRKFGSHRYVESGLSNVFLENIETAECLECGAKAVSIPAIARLHELLARTIARSVPRLSANEIRFLRKFLGWSGKDFAGKIGVSVETVSRWENAREAMGVPAERLLRALVLRSGPDRKALDRIEDLALKGASPRNRIRLELENNAWRFERDTAG